MAISEVNPKSCRFHVLLWKKIVVMAARSPESAFSQNGQYFANVSTDGRLKIWECESGRAKQEFIPTSHLSAACTCLVWAPSKQPEQVIFLQIKKCYELYVQFKRHTMF